MYAIAGQPNSLPSPDAGTTYRKFSPQHIALPAPSLPFSGEQDEKDVDLSAAPPMLRTWPEARTKHSGSKRPGQEAVADGGSSDAAGESAPAETESRIPVSNSGIGTLVLFKPYVNVGMGSKYVMS